MATGSTGAWGSATAASSPGTGFRRRADPPLLFGRQPTRRDGGEAGGAREPFSPATRRARGRVRGGRCRGGRGRGRAGPGGRRALGGPLGPGALGGPRAGGRRPGR